MRARPTSRSDRPTFLSSNKWGIPDLDRQFLQTTIPSNLCPFRTIRKPESDQDSLCFFIDDYRFQCAWTYPARMLASIQTSGWRSVCEPDFSIWSDRPKAEQIWNVYRNRWIGRLWQTAGLNVIPVVNWSDEFSFHFAFAGIPFRPPMIAIEVQTNEPTLPSFRAGLIASHQAIRPQLLLIYGAENPLPALPETEVIWFKPFSHTIRKRKS